MAKQDTENKYFRGWMFIGLSKNFPKGKIKKRTFMHEECLVYRAESGELNMVEPYCSHFGVNMATGKVIKDYIQCPMHGRTFKGDGTCTKVEQKSIRSYPVAEDRGLAYAWFDNPGVEPQWEHPKFLNDEDLPDILWAHARTMDLHHPSVPQNNAVDPRHFEFTHSMFGKETVPGEIRTEGHEAWCKMGTELLSPLKNVAGGDTSEVITYYSGFLNDYLQSRVGAEVQHLCNFLTVIDGKKCKLTQVGVGKKSLNPIKRFQDWVGAFGSWYATYEDDPIWSNRKPIEPDYYPHETDKAIKAFTDWADSFAYTPEPEPESVEPEGKKLKLAQI